VRDETTTIEKVIMQNVAAIGENVVVRRFQRWELGESTSQA
jgi:elongation factor Ts